MKRLSLRAISPAGIARVSGAVFVFLGGCLSLALADQAFSVPPQVFEAQVATVTEGDNDAGTTTEGAEPGIDSQLEVTDESSDDSSSGTNADENPNHEPEPEPQIAIQQVINEEVPINVFVPHAIEVKLFLYQKESGTNYFLGEATDVSDTHWRLGFDSTEFANGEYKLKVLIVNEIKTYHRFRDPVFIENVIQTETELEGVTVDGDTTEEDTITTETGSNESESIDAETNEVGVDESLTDSEDIDSTAEVENVVSTEEDDGTQIVAESDPVLLKTTDESIVEFSLDPVFEINVRDGFVAADTVSFGSKNQNIDSVEAFLKPRFGGVGRFVAKGRSFDVDRWRFTFDSNNIPNGEYALILVAKNDFGEFFSEPKKFYVFNELLTTATTEQEKEIKEIVAQKEVIDEIIAADNAEELNQIALDTAKVVDDEAQKLSVEQNTQPSPNPVTEPKQSESDATELVNDSDASETNKEVLNDDKVEELNEVPNVSVPKIDRVEDVQIESETDKAELQEAVNRLVVSVRNGDDRAIDRARRNLQSVKESIAVEDPEVAEELERTVANVESRTIRQVAVIRDRAGDDVFKDQDNDGISDYDEVHLYDTDPFVADSDGDGFVDGAEVLSGFDPKDAKPEALVAFESPKETGLVREDILVVENIRSVPVEEKSLEGEVESGNIQKPVVAAEISGKALPNSFVTLYIFSTPVVITVKTDADGSWSYTFDKELEDGEHEVFVGITDNAGKIVAKSNPLTFVKEAEAFTPVAAAAEPSVVAQTAPITQQQSLISEYMLLLVMSVAVVAIGLVLILLGIYYEEKAQTKPQALT